MPEDSPEVSITCPFCGLVSHNPGDVKAEYCGFCHVFHPDVRYAIGLLHRDWREEVLEVIVKMQHDRLARQRGR